jgi:hypothetical protein
MRQRTTVPGPRRWTAVSATGPAAPQVGHVASAPVMSAVGLPETWLVAVEQFQAPHPLRALPEVQVRHEQASRAAVLGFERLAVVAERHPGLDR